MAAGKIGGQPIDWNQHGPKIALALHNQGSEWFALLTGQKAAVDLLGIDNYVTAGEGMVRQYRHLGGRFLAQWWPWLVGGAVIVAIGVFLFWHYGKGDTKGLGTIATLLAGVGVTAKTATSTIEKTATDIGTSLWQAELDGAIVSAATSLPAGDTPIGGGVYRPWQILQRKGAEAARDARDEAVADRTAARAAVALAEAPASAAWPASPQAAATPPAATGGPTDVASGA